MISVTLLRAARRTFLAGATAFVVGTLAVPSFVTPTIASDGPPSVADLAERLLGAVVNISTTQSVEASPVPEAMPEMPPGSPFEDLFRDFFERQRRGDQGRGVRGCSFVDR